jgi:hypothetical protein
MAILWAFFISGVGSLAQANPGSSYWLCRRGMEVRTLRIQNTDSGCLAYYTKEGVDDKIGDSKEIELCKSVILKVKGILEYAGWKCKDISSARISR